MLLGVESKSGITVEPVVVIPDILSKKASLSVNLIDDNINGKLPKRAIKTQAKAENKKVCCKLSVYFWSKLFKINSKPMKIVMKADDKKLWLASS